MSNSFETLGPAAPIRSLAHVFYEGEGLGIAIDYIDETVAQNRKSVLLTEANTDLFSQVNAKEVIANYRRDLSVKEYLNLVVNRSKDSPTGEVGAATTIAMQAAVLSSALYGNIWLERTEDIRRNLFEGQLDAFDYSQTIMARLLRLRLSKRLINVGFGRDISDELASKVLERSEDISKIHEDSGRPVRETLTSTAVAFTHLASRNAVLYALRGALPFAGKKNAAAFKSQIRRIRTEPVHGSSGVVSMPLKSMVNAADFAIHQMARSGARQPMGGELKEAVNHFADEAKALIYIGMVLMTGAGQDLNEDLQDKERTSRREELEAQRLLAEQKRSESKVRSKQNAEQARLDYEKILGEIREIKKSNDEFAENWTFTSNHLKKNGLNELIGCFVRGLKNIHDEVVFPGTSKEEAKQMVCTIEKLSMLLASEGGAKEVKAVISAEGRLQDQLGERVDALMQDIRSLNSSYRQRLSNAIPELFSTQALVSKLQNNYPELREAIRKQHPNGNSVVAALDEIFSSEEKQEEHTELTVLPLPEAVDPEHRLMGIAKQLDKIILPPKATIDDLKQEILKLDLPADEIESIDWDRLYDLVTLRDIYDGTLYRSKKGSLGGAPPYYVVAIEYEDNVFAVAESPVEGNATYIISQREVGGSWLEALTHSKAEARILGAHRIIHRNGSSHIDKIENCLIDLMTIE